MEKLNQEGMEYETKTAFDGTKKSGAVYALERLGADNLRYVGRLQLTPQSVEQGRIDTAKKGFLVEVLKKSSRLSENDNQK